MSDVTVYTIGHSDRTFETLLSLLRAHRIESLWDVRAFPRSRRHPHFDRQRLDGDLTHAGVDYRHAPELGGMRKPRPDSTNNAWREEGFRGYADHMETDIFRGAIGALIEAAGKRRVTVMCAEASPEHCHRKLLSDALTAAGVTVRHILRENEPATHRLTPFARVADGRVSYPALF